MRQRILYNDKSQGCITIINAYTPKNRLSKYRNKNQKN